MSMCVLCMFVWGGLYILEFDVCVCINCACLCGADCVCLDVYLCVCSVHVWGGIVHARCVSCVFVFMSVCVCALCMIVYGKCA